LQAALRAAGVSEPELAELAGYTERRFESPAGAPVEVPLPDEPLAAPWAVWAAQARDAGAAAVLGRIFPQLSFPIRAGISQSPDYVAATLKGVAPAELAEATGLPLERPDGIELELHPSVGGRVPIVTVRHRGDFVTLVQALTRRNEPVAVPASQGASMVAGLPNWERIRALRREWEARPRGAGDAESWPEELRRIQQRRELYQDRLILLSDGPYSGVPAVELGLDEDRWRRLSLVIRREHECTHYFTRRAYGSMKNHLLDELMADYAGLAAAFGAFRADLLLHLLGLGAAGPGQKGRRFDIYRGDPPLSDGTFRALETVVVRAADNLEACERALWPGGPPGGSERAAMVQALAVLGLEGVAAPGGAMRLEQACRSGVRGPGFAATGG
jgi:hypothetical protein